MASEPFPLLNTSADQLHNTDANATRRRRKSSALGAGSDIRGGDTGAPALATSRASINANEANGHQVRFPLSLRVAGTPPRRPLLALPD